MDSFAAGSGDQEFTAIQAVYTALNPLDAEARTRVISYIVDRLEIKGSYAAKAATPPTPEQTTTTEDVAQTDRPSASHTEFKTFAELYDAAKQPDGNPSRALIAGYWLQVCGGQEAFDSQSANKELKNLGIGVVNITDAIDSLKNKKPALALQIKKSGSSRQARKLYKLTVSGVRAVEEMMNG